MHEIEPFYRWEKYYISTMDENSPFYGREYEFMKYSNDIYGYFIHPYWDYIGSDTLYTKLLFADYKRGFCVMEFLGEWNDAINNDIMHLKNNVINPLVEKGVNQFILIGENVMNYHGSDDCYYEEWFEDVEDGWIAAINFREFVLDEWGNFNLDWYVNYGGNLDVHNWRTLKPIILYNLVKEKIARRIALT
ncbi:hypothetical protein [Flexithrix dorotheae]|uniref:hypothetical protein n=1 Tax=Flexithrix dorotheae TaxID=70993 RepID=UPI000373064D|nr:hypothetical protein [Flexithrix dorotheae]